MTYPSTEYLVKVAEGVEEYLAHRTSDIVKPKRFEVIQAAYYPMWKAQMAIPSTIKEIEVSHLIGQNDVVLGPLVQEYRDLRTKYEAVHAAIDTEVEFKGKTIKLRQIGELKPHVLEIQKLTKTKVLGQLLFDDLKQLCTTYDIRADLKVYMDKFKQED